MTTPKHLAHKPITSIDDYSKHDGIYANNTDVKSLSVGKAQYDGNEVSVKVFRHTGKKWSRQSEELPLHRVIDLNTAILKSILISGNVPTPLTNLDVDVISSNDLQLIVDYYKNHRDILLPKLQELQTILNYFIQDEPKL
jgi:exosome complex RNA-binding protein Csl4